MREKQVRSEREGERNNLQVNETTSSVIRKREWQRVSERDNDSLRTRMNEREQRSKLGVKGKAEINEETETTTRVSEKDNND